MTELKIGTVLPEVVTTSVRPDDIKVVALILRDPNPIHFDLEAAAKAGMGDRVVNQGGSTMAYIVNYLADWAGSRAAVRTVTCSFRGNVLACDDVSVGAIVTSIENHEDGFLVGYDVWADVLGGRRAISGSANVLVDGSRLVAAGD